MNNGKRRSILCSLNLHEWHQEIRRPFVDSYGYIVFENKNRTCLRCRLRQEWVFSMTSKKYGHWIELK